LDINRVLPQQHAETASRLKSTSEQLGQIAQLLTELQLMNANLDGLRRELRASAELDATAEEKKFGLPPQPRR
jgi:hypothetical protein